MIIDWDAERDYRADVGLDRFALELECEKQASIFMYWSEKLADAEKEVRRLSMRLDYTKSKLSYDIRKQNKSDKKLTEGMVSAEIEINEEVLKINEDLLKAHHTVGILSGAIKGLTQKKSEIDNLRALLISGFYADPRGDRDTEKTTAAIRKKLNT